MPFFSLKFPSVILLKICSVPLTWNSSSMPVIHRFDISQCPKVPEYLCVCFNISYYLILWSNPFALSLHLNVLSSTRSVPSVRLSPEFISQLCYLVFQFHLHFSCGFFSISISLLNYQSFQILNCLHYFAQLYIFVGFLFLAAIRRSFLSLWSSFRYFFVSSVLCKLPELLNYIYDCYFKFCVLRLTCVIFL